MFPDIRDDGTSVLYADDDTDNVRHKDPDILQQKIQQIANNSTAWVHDNKLVCSGSKTKLLVIDTKELRKSRLINKNKVLEIEVAGHKVKESECERLLGLVVNNSITWKNHLYGNKENKGLIPKLSQRAGIIRKLSYIMPRDKLNTIAEGIFFSLLNYCVEVYGNVWGLPTYDDQVRHSTAFRKEDNMKLQILVNKVLRSLTGLERETPVSCCHLSVENSLFSSVQPSSPSTPFTDPCKPKSLSTATPHSNPSQTKKMKFLIIIPTATWFTVNSQYPGVDITTGGVVCTTYFQPASHKASHNQLSRRGPSNGFKPTFRYFHLR